MSQNFADPLLPVSGKTSGSISPSAYLIFPKLLFYGRFNNHI